MERSGLKLTAGTETWAGLARPRRCADQVARHRFSRKSADSLRQSACSTHPPGPAPGRAGRPGQIGNGFWLKCYGNSRPWQFPDNAVEMRYHAFVYQTFVDRSKDLIRIHFLCILVMNIVAGTVKYFVLDKRDNLEDAVMALRFVGTTSLAYFYLSKWSDSAKPMAARIYFWVGDFSISLVFWLRLEFWGSQIHK